LSRLACLRILIPLRRRDFALLWSGMAVSLIGDGIYTIAIVWQALRLSNTAMAISLVGVAWTLPTVGFLILGGAVSDRIDRRRLMLWASLAQALAVATIGALAAAGGLEMWTLLCLVAAYGIAEAFFLPAFEALIPMLVAPAELPQASALDQVVRPLALRLLGPALGGLVITVSGTSTAFLLDAATFLAGAATLFLLRPATAGWRVDPVTSARLNGIGEAMRFVRTNPWLWRTLLAACLTLLLFYGPYEVVLPFLVKDSLHGGSATLGLIRALGGGGALLAALLVSQTGVPARALRAMFTGWALQSLTLAGYAMSREAWLFAAVSFLGGACGAVGNVVWGTLLKTRVPNRLLGRVASLDLLVSIGLVPVSFALAGPVAGALGPRVTLLGGGLLAGTALLLCLSIPGSERSPNRRASRAEVSHPGGTTSW
jgi:MFS family permease